MHKTPGSMSQSQEGPQQPTATCWSGIQTVLHPGAAAGLVRGPRSRGNARPRELTTEGPRVPRGLTTEGGSLPGDSIPKANPEGARRRVTAGDPGAQPRDSHAGGRGRAAPRPTPGPSHARQGRGPGSPSPSGSPAWASASAPDGGRTRVAA